MHKAATYGVRSSVVLLVALLSSTLAAGASPDSCRRECAGTEIPYPFGLDTDSNTCYRDKNFSLTCNESYSPPKLFLRDAEVISISLPTAAKLRILVGMSYQCYTTGASGHIWDMTLWDAYTFSETDNVFTGVGCDTLAEIEGPKKLGFTAGCLSVCDNSSTTQEDECSGIGCCQAEVPKGLQRYNTSFDSRYNHSRVIDFNPCSYSFLVEKGNYTFSRSNLASMDTNWSFPVVLDWVIDSLSCQEAAKNKASYACISSNSVCLDSYTATAGYICNCSQGFQGNPYVFGGCQDIDECKDQDTYPCLGICTNLPGTYNCTCPAGTVGNIKYGCRTLRFPVITSIIIGLSSGIAALLLLVLGIILYKRIQKRRTKKIRERFFHHNFDMLTVQQHIAYPNGNESLVNKIKIFSLKDIQKATDNFDGSRIIGQGAHGTVYKGLLELMVVAIKKTKVTTQEAITSFLNEVILLSQINHRNVVQLLGCCLETEVPIIVYEFISNGTLSEHIHVRNQESPLSWDERLRISIEITSGLSYLHTAANISILHRDIKSSNILLDEILTAKVSDFGSSKTIKIDQTHVSTDIEGTFGYLDPEYLHTGQLTDKSDVYSLGVILVELLTGQKPNSKISSYGDKNLISYFCWALKNNKLFDVVVKSILDDVNKAEVEVVAELAVHCLRIRGKDRPTMKDIEITLEGLMKGKQGKK